MEGRLWAVTIQWTGLLDWTTGLDYWTGLLDWTTGLTETTSGGERNSNPQSYKDTRPQGLKQCCSCTLECSFVFGVRGHMGLRTEKGTKVAGNLLHVSSYRALNIIHTER